MAKIRTLEKEAVLLAEIHGHRLFLPDRHLGREWEERQIKATCADCDEEIVIAGRGCAPMVAGPVNRKCPKKGDR